MSSVLYLCSKLTPKQVFSPLSISQPVILSLIHHLSLDLKKSTASRLQWIQECLLNLDTGHESVSMHCARVLKGVYKRIEEDEGVGKAGKVVGMILKGMF